MTSILDQIQQGQPPPAIPDPQPHLAPGGGDPAGQLASLLAGGAAGGGGPDPAPGPQDPAGGPYGPDKGTGPDESHDTAAHAHDEISSLKQMLGLGHHYMSINTVEPSEAHAMSKAVMILTKLLADNQQQTDQITGGSPAMRKAGAQ